MRRSRQGRGGGDVDRIVGRGGKCGGKSMSDGMLIKVTWPDDRHVFVCLCVCVCEPAICSGIANRLWQIDGNRRQINQNLFYLFANDSLEERVYEWGIMN